MENCAGPPKPGGRRGMNKFRWLNDRDQFRYVGRACPERKGQLCRCVVLPRPGPGGPKNVTVEFGDGFLMTAPHGTLRKAEQLVRRNPEGEGG